VAKTACFAYPLRIVTDRPMGFYEIRDSTRSMDYTIRIVDFRMPPDGGEGLGILLLACKAKFHEHGSSCSNRSRETAGLSRSMR
jgi:hypothetical protein